MTIEAIGATLRLALVVFAAFAIAACAGGASSGSAPSGSAPGTGASGGQCDGFAGTRCASDSEYCRHEIGACIEIADDAGVCTPRPEICTRDYRPVCGCDGRTYSNACGAAAEGVSIAAIGPCTER